MVSMGATELRNAGCVMALTTMSVRGNKTATCASSPQTDLAMLGCHDRASLIVDADWRAGLD
jgi:hypothetical protein